MLACLLLLTTINAALAEAPTITHGVATGDVTPHSAVLWARGSGPGRIEVQLIRLHGPALDPVKVLVDGSTDFTGHIRLVGLRPDHPYAALVSYVDAEGVRSPPVEARFRTAPRKGKAAPLRLAFSGDLGGQGRCRQVAEDGAELGYPIFSAILKSYPTLFLMNGDQIYADDVCAAGGRAPNGAEPAWNNVPGDFASVAEIDWTDTAALAETYWAHWRYNRADLGYQALLAGVPLLAQWDDHEVINDFGGEWTTWHPSADDRPGYANLVAAGRDAFYHYNPLDVAAVQPGGIYRSFRWGKDAEIFLVDARSYRSPNRRPDGEDKTLLGQTQLDWLVDGLTRSHATFKIVSVDVPLSVATGTEPEENGHDAWANGAGEVGEAAELGPRSGFERELRVLLTRLDAAGVKNLVFITTDVHFPQISRYALDLNGDGQVLRFAEVIAGPLAAFPADVRVPDPTFSPEVLYAEGGLYNFGLLTLTRPPKGEPTLKAEIRDAAGATRPGSTLELVAE